MIIIILDSDKFDFGDDADSISTLYVEGNSRGTSSGGALALSVSDNQSRSSSSSSSSNKTFSSSSKGASFTVKVTKAIRNLNSAGKAEFTPLEVGYLGISSSTANVYHISEMVKEKWGKDYTLVSNEGLPIGDSTGTRGKARTNAVGVCSVIGVNLP